MKSTILGALTLLVVAIAGTSAFAESKTSTSETITNEANGVCAPWVRRCTGHDGNIN